MKSLDKWMGVGLRGLCVVGAVAWVWRTWIFRTSPPDVAIGIVLVVGLVILALTPWNEEPKTVDKERARRVIEQINEAKPNKAKAQSATEKTPGPAIRDVLEFLAREGKAHPAQEIRKKCLVSPSVISEAKKHGWVNNPSRGMWVITDKGKTMVKPKTRPGESQEAGPSVWDTLRGRAGKGGFIRAGALLEVCDDPVGFVETWKSGNPSKRIRTKRVKGELFVHLEDFRQARREFEQRFLGHERQS